MSSVSYTHLDSAGWHAGDAEGCHLSYVVLIELRRPYEVYRIYGLEG